MSSTPHPPHSGAAVSSKRDVSSVPWSVEMGRSAVIGQGRTESTCGGYLPGMLQGVASVEDFANVLCVLIRAIPLIILINRPCCAVGCPSDIAEGNGNHCPYISEHGIPFKMHLVGIYLVTSSFKQASQSPMKTATAIPPPIDSLDTSLGKAPLLLALLSTLLRGQAGHKSHHNSHLPKIA